jgi:hypothetical protein
VISLFVESALTPRSADLNCSSALNFTLTAFSRSALLRTMAVVPLRAGALLLESSDLSQATAAIANSNITTASGLWIMKTPPQLSLFLTVRGKKYATGPGVSQWTFALRSPCLSPPLRLLVPKPVRVREVHMAELGRHAMSKIMNVPITSGRKESRDELFFSIDVDAGMQRQMI